jgi:hypothetical protein
MSGQTQIRTKTAPRLRLRKPTLTPAQTEALDRDGDGAAGGSLPRGRVAVRVTEAGSGRVHTGEGGTTHPAGAALVVTEAQAETLRVSGFVR